MKEALYVDANPTKQFFMDMLTRDIDLKDAILDLLDNCLDGVVRSKKIPSTREVSDYYKGYAAKITITTNSFSIEDNCGGIPQDVAMNYAFKMGHDPKEKSMKLPTVGIYGIGMKRAIFKIGREAIISTKHEQDAYKVMIESDWASLPDWKFPLSRISSSELKEAGTIIKISNLTQEVAFLWRNETTLDSFISDLSETIATHYSLILSKGFHIILNGKEILPAPMNFVITTEKTGVKPYIYQCEKDNVSIKLAVGFYAKPPSEEEIQEEMEAKRSSQDAGWSIICNDRVIVYNDRTAQTGWGEAGIPKYHTQFIGIRGVVIFESTDPVKLPMTTTKRGLNLSSELYSEIKNKMREGMRLFITYTNQWKGDALKLDRNFLNVEKVSYRDVLLNTKDFQQKYQTKFKQIRAQKANVFVPNLPKPDKNNKSIRIVYSKPIDKYNLLKHHYEKDSADNLTPSDIGSLCFDEVLQQIQEDKYEI